MAISADQAIEATRSLFTDVKDPHKVVATEHGDSLWIVSPVDESNRPWPGSLIVVGADHQVWSFSSNPAIHDPDTVFTALREIYAAGVASSVDPDLLAERIASVTAEITAQRRAIIVDAEAGSLRERPQRRLP